MKKWLNKKRQQSLTETMILINAGMMAGIVVSGSLLWMIRNAHV